jgi:hypothetical protein
LPTHSSLFSRIFNRFINHHIFDDDVLNEDWIIYRMVRSRRLLSLVLVAIGVDRRISSGSVRTGWLTRVSVSVSVSIVLKAFPMPVLFYIFRVRQPVGPLCCHYWGLQIGTTA